ncbi:MAG: metalloprotease TldD [Bauldia sp.]|uniref:metalloprotease TldD n=1 Tax=Bauldia sp. TaxID=2575872 RepID=UPI001DED006F|nr:metalloprotease TldD [Bauldia sp.]MCB1494590.1 metalloprotease TldD [Bauldia sp.]
MTDKPHSLLDRAGLDPARATTLLADALRGADDGELYFEFAQSEGLVFDNGRLKSASFDTNQGFGLRAVAGEAAGYAHSGEISEQAIKRAADAVQAVKAGHTGVYADGPQGTNRSLYGDESPLGAPSFAEKVKLLEKIDAYARQKDDKVRQVTASLAGSYKVVEILRADGRLVRDVRPLVRVGVNVVVGDGDRQESGSHGMGGREGFAHFVTGESWQSAVDEALRQALVNLTAVPAPAGTFDIVLGPGWPGILLHEAVGHGLEGDFNRKKESAFAGLMGERVASPGVTVIDDGTIPGRRGSLTVDDEGTPTSSTTLIEDGILVGYMQDRQNARLMGMAPTGNGRRESYAHIPMPRMTNTIMLGGEADPAEVLASVKDGIYAVSFGGGQVDITSGKFVFSCTEAYRIEGGRIGPAIKGAMLIGNGPDALTRVRMIGNDMQLDPGIGTCGKQGQGVPVGVGQPTLRIDKITVGGTA